MDNAPLLLRLPIAFEVRYWLDGRCAQVRIELLPDRISRRRKDNLLTLETAAPLREFRRSSRSNGSETKRQDFPASVFGKLPTWLR